MSGSGKTYAGGRRGAEPRTLSPSRAKPEAPWLGLDSFEEADEDYFFGRTRERDELFQRIRSQPLTLLYGRSGLGKSSLLAAGLVPKLVREGYAPVTLRFGFEEADPPLVTQVRAAYREAAGKEPSEFTIWESLHRLDLVAENEVALPVLIIDQFEELFTRGWQKRRGEVDELLRELADVVENREPESLREQFFKRPEMLELFYFGQGKIRVLISLREDYLAQLESYKELVPALMRNRMSIHELDGPKALRAVVEPGRLGGRELVSEEVGHDIVCFVAKRPKGTSLDEIRAVPPLLSLLCKELNRARLRKGAAEISATQVAEQSSDVLQSFYDRSLENMPPGVRCVVEDLLIDERGHYRESSSRDTVVAKMQAAEVEEADKHLDDLITGRLLSAQTRDGAQRIELTHDLLVPLVHSSRQARRARENEAANQRALVRQEFEESRERQLRVAIGLAITMTALAMVALLAFWKAHVYRGERDQVLQQAAQRAFGRAQEAVAQGQPWRQSAYLAESLSYSEQLAVRRSAVMVLLQAPASPFLAAIRHQEQVTSASFSPDGTLVVTASVDGTARVWEAATGAAVGPPMRHEDVVYSASFSPDGSRVVTASGDGTGRIWETASGGAVGQPMRHEGVVYSAVFSPDGTRVVTASEDGTVRVWEAASGAAVGQPIREDTVTSAVFSPDGARVVAATWDGAARVWEAASGRAVGQPLRHENTVTSASFSADGSRVVTASEDATARIWEAATGAAVGPPMRHEDVVYSASFSPDSTLVVTASEDGTARIWEAASGRAVGQPMRHEDVVYSASFSRDGTRVVTASVDGTAQLWEAASGAAVGQPMRHEKAVYLASFSPDGTLVVTVSWDGTTRIWEAANGAAVGQPMRHDDAVLSASFSPDGTRVVTASYDTAARIWEAASGRAVGPPMRHQDVVFSASFNPDGTQVVTASEDGTARVWEAASGASVGQPMGTEDPVASASFSPDGALVVTASEDESARIWEAASGAAVGQPMRHQDMVYSASFSPDGTQVVTASEDGTARIWGAASGTAVGPPMRHEDVVFSASFSPDGTQVVTASEDGNARIWDAASGRAVGQPMRHEDDVFSASFNPDGTQVVTASWDGTARIWEASSSAAVGQPMRHRAPVISASFSSDGARVVTASMDGTARIWEVSLDPPLDSADLILALQVLLGRRVAENGRLEELNPEEMVEGRRQLSTIASVDSDFARVILWHLTDRTTRTISPFSELTVPEHIEREISWSLSHPEVDSQPLGLVGVDDSSRDILNDAYALDPSHPLILLALSVFEDRPETRKLWKELSMPRIEGDARIAARAAEILQQDNDPDYAARAAQIALDLEPGNERAQAVLDWATQAQTEPVN